MKKSSKKSRSEGAQSKRSHLTLVDVVRHNLQAFVIRQGMLAFQEMLKEEQEALCGPGECQDSCRLIRHGPLAEVEAPEHSLSTTNVLENLNGSIRRVSRNVKNWKDGKMIQRWAAAGIIEASSKFRKLRGFQDLEKLASSLAEYAEQTPSIDDSEVAA